MRFSTSLVRGCVLVLGALWLSGCVPSSGQLEEEKEPHFLAGKTRLGRMDYAGAVESFQKALEINPQSAAAHFELAYLFDQKVPDPVAAIYHYDHYLKLRPKAPDAAVWRTRILACKQAIAGSVSLGPMTDRLQRNFEQIAEENKRLKEDNKALKDQLDQLRGLAARIQPMVNQPGARVSSNRPPAELVPTGSGVIDSPLASTNRVPAVGLGSTASTLTGRTHVVKAGETPVAIAKRYGVKLDALLAANPRLDPRRMKVGQSLTIPGN